MHEHHKEIAVLYHGGCPDGFGGAYAAWKKFGDTAEYIPAGYADSAPENLAGREVYLVDFCYESAKLLAELIRTTKRFVVLDHHESNRTRVESVPEHVYDATRAGASIAWEYFHPGTTLPRLMTYLEDGDLYHYALPETRDIFSYLLVLPFDFQKWDEFMNGLEDDAQRAKLLEKAGAYTEFFNALAQMSIERAKKVRFEGYEVHFAATHPNITMRSYVGKQLYTKLPPFAIIVTAHPNGLGVSLRGDDSVDVSKIAAKYGGGGHTGSAGFFLPYSVELPWTEIEDENPRH